MASLMSDANQQETSPQELLQFLANATKRLSSPDFLTELGTHLSQHPMDDRGAVFEQVIAHEYSVLWPKSSSKVDEEEEEEAKEVPVTNELPTPLLSAAKWADVSRDANVAAGREVDARNDPTLHRVLELLDLYVNEKPDPKFTPQILRGWQQLELMEERVVLRSSLPDEQYATFLRRDRDCDEYGEKCYKDLNEDLPLLTPQGRVNRAQEIQKEGMETLLAKAPTFAELEPGEKQKVIQDLTFEERKPVILMNVLNVVMGQMQKMQMLGQNMIQQFIQQIPHMPPAQQKETLEKLRSKAFEVLPDNFIDLTAEERQKAAMLVPYAKKLPVLRWNAMCAALSMLRQRQMGGGGGHGHTHDGKPCGGHGHGH